MSVSRETLVQRAQALVPKLKERAEAANATRQVPAETIRDFQEAGFFRILQPARFGGYELDPQTLYDVQIIVASACPSSAWVLGILSVHTWQLALFDAKAQDEVWGEDDQVLISSSYMPVGKVTPVEGGFRFSGRWGFSSGSAHCQWAFLGGFVPPQGEHKAPDMRTFLVPRSDYRIEENWDVAGLQATGSNDIVVEDAFVPEHRTHRFSDGFKCSSPGQRVNDGALYRLPFGQIFVRSVSTPAIGMAQGALQVYREDMARRIGRGDGTRKADNPGAQSACADAAATIDEVKLVLYRNFDEMMALAQADEPIPVERRVKFRYDSARAVVRCVEAVDKLFTAAGSGAIFRSHLIQRYFQDVHACRAHYANNPLAPAQNYGRTQLGIENQDYFI